MTRRRQFTAAFKAQVVLALRSGAKRSAAFCRAPQMAASVFADGQTMFLRHAPAAVDSPAYCHGQEATHVAALERLGGR
jgi:transposase